jgi:CBS domain-containing protein
MYYHLEFMMKAKDILDVKGRKIFSITESSTIFHAVDELVKYQVGLLIVKNQQGAIVGVLSERDIVKKWIHQKKEPITMNVRDIMTRTSELVAASEEDDLQVIMNIMTERRIRHVPIFHGQELTGIISIGDIVKNLLEIKEYEIKTLIDYVSGNYPR